MAHAALVYLMNLLDEDFIQFPCRVLEVEEEKARVFLFKSYKVLVKRSKFKHFCDIPYSSVMALRRLSEPLSLTIHEDLLDAARSSEIQLDSRVASIRIPEVLYELDRLNSFLKNILQDLNGEVTSHLACTIREQRELANDLLAAGEKFRKVVEFFYVLQNEARALCHATSSLLRRLDGFDHDTVNYIKFTADIAGDAIEDFLRRTDDRWFEKDDFMDSKNIQNLFEHVKKLDLIQVRAHTSERSKEAITKRDLPKDERKPERKPERKLPKDGMEKFDDAKRNSFQCTGVDRDDISNLIDDLTKPSLGLKTVRIFQSGDTSKSTLAGNVYRYATVALKFDLCIRVRGKSNTDQVLSKILHCIERSRDGIDGRGIEDKGKLLYESLQGKKYLIILDGLPNFEVWDDVIHRFFPDDKVGSRVLLSSFLYPERPWKLLDEHEGIVVGRDEDMREIIDELIGSTAALLVVTIEGMGGIGKTTLAKKVFDHPEITYRFHCLAWANTRSDIDQELSHLLHSVAPSCEKVQGLSIEDKGEMLCRSLKGRRFLIVADGLLNSESWINAIQEYLPDDKVGSRILITTRINVMEFPFSRNIATNPPHCVAPLDRHQSWELLEKLVFGLKSCLVELVGVGKQIAEGCGGIPLVIVVIAGILHSIPRTYASWWGIKRDVNSIVVVDSKPCLDILGLSYTHLPHHLKACFLYMGAFPENFEVGVKYLLNLWIANGFLNIEPLNRSETEASKYLKDLIGRNLICVGKKGLDGKVKTCFIPALVRELCLREAEKEKFMHISETGGNTHFLENHRHLIFNLDHLDDFELLPPLPHLRSFKWLNACSGFTPGILLIQMSVFKWLRVLDIYLVPFDTFPSQLLNLINLRYLALNATYELDAQISQFLKLEILVVYGPWVPGEGDADPSLPLEFWKMPWLRGVYVKVTSSLRYPYLLGPILDVCVVPSNLQSISTITFSSCTREVLLLMPNLKKLGVSETKKDFEDGELTKCFRNLSFLAKLQTLKCSFYEGNREPRTLGWAFLPVSLRKLTLNGSHLSWEEMKFVALLPLLETLKLKRAFRGPEWVVAAEEVFGSLKHLMIENTDLVNWEVESMDHFPCLERLVLRSCKLLEKIPEDVAALSVLEVIELHNCSESAKASAQEYEEENGYPKVVCSGYM